MTQIDSLTDELIAFRDERDWKQFHNSKDLALAVSIEAAELNELFLWKSAEAVDEQKLKHELADIMAYCLLLAHNHSIDVEQALRAKIEINRIKYPVDKAKGNAKKYNEL